MDKKVVSVTKFLTFNYVLNPPSSTMAGEHNYFIENKKGEILGYVNFYKPWNKYVFTPNITITTIFDIQCLQAITSFMRDLKK